MMMNGAYTVDELAAHIQTMLRQQDIHPNYQQKWVVTKKMSTDGSQFEGFNLVCDQIAPVSSTASFKKPTNMVAVNFSGPGVKYDTSTGKVERDSIDPSEHAYARTSHPMNLNLGQFVVNFTDMFDLTSSTKEIDHVNAIGIGRNSSS